MAQFAIKDIQPNPFRHIERYPIRRNKVDALRESLKKTGFWDNIVARIGNGEPQIAYGHHRLVALREEYSSDKEVNLIIRDLSDEMMLQIMAQENMEEWGTSAPVEQETVRAVVEAYAEGKIKLRGIDPKTYKGQVRYAPSFLLREVSVDRNFAYSRQTVAEFLGWLKPSGEARDKVYSTLTALQLIEEGILKESDFEGLSTRQAQAVAEQARKAKARRDTAAQLAAQEVERAHKDAEEAEDRRQKAEAEAAKVQEEEPRRQAEEQARRAEQEVRAAKRRAATETRKQKEEQKKGREQAAAAGKIVSEELKAGHIGYKGAADVAARVVEKKEGPIPDINQFAGRLATSLHRVLDTDRDDNRIDALNKMVKFKDNIGRDIRADLIKTLYLAASRFTNFAEQLGGTEYQKLAGRG